MNTILQQIGELGIVPVIALADAQSALPLADALVAGGLPCAEVTFRTAAGEEAIRLIAKKHPNILVGAGTVLTTEQAKRAIDAGARFVVSPGFNPNVVDFCVEQRIPVIPGCITPTEMEQAIERGLEVVKFFPAEQAGGLSFIKAVSAPYPMLSFVPTGGVGTDNVADYLSFGKVLACGGSWMVRKDLIDGGRFDEIEVLCAEASSIVKKVRKV
ncbi:MAG: bifunctional 4-hydroxy-2-oxoglutarate aldolase/2-dehydro-3-deoxy-phosphogluconate aldolase [Clostridiales Family XIII bacterium]|jgi:2-dehydro-3-deoxyphosphogluconate aldolase/(4S)-4-hydroxy-2-oxoglutarate aldolase|nr:bifunctional 4-hydroxy-2-oxoglutarate aldolase/2-dehydro-3-deoxy-phosphogluconate aldolase [Clostridiales Family XIII bacterium]